MRAHAGGDLKYVVDVNGETFVVELDGDGLRVDGELMHAHLAVAAGTPIHLLSVGDAKHRIAVRRGDERGRYALWTDGYRFEVEVLDERTRAIRALAGTKAGAKGPAPLVAPMPGLIVRVHVKAGDLVQAGQGLVVMEAMKMENELRVTVAGRVTDVRVTNGAIVEKGAVLVEME